MPALTLSPVCAVAVGVLVAKVTESEEIENVVSLGASNLVTDFEGENTSDLGKS